jgi:peroxiredoxin Q/BCP
MRRAPRQEIPITIGRPEPTPRGLLAPVTKGRLGRETKRAFRDMAVMSSSRRVVTSDTDYVIAHSVPARAKSRQVVRKIPSSEPFGSVKRMLDAGDPAPPVRLPDQHGEMVSLGDYAGRKVLVYFYPKASTPGCTTQACGLRDIAGRIGTTAILGVSPDPPKAQQRFDDKYGLGFPLLSDADHTVAEAFDVWKQKSMYGRTYMGIERSAFLVNEHGAIEQAWYKISPKDTPTRLLEALGP